jgi:hypothetical protein
MFSGLVGDRVFPNPKVFKTAVQQIRKSKLLKVDCSALTSHSPALWTFPIIAGRLPSRPRSPFG